MSDLTTTAPPVVKWYRLYAGAMAALYLLVLLAGVGMLIFLPGNEPSLRGTEKVVVLTYVGFLVALGAALGAAFGASLFLPPKPWVWIYDLVLIAIGLTSPCCLPASVPLLIFWIRRDTQAYFGRS